MPLVTTLLIERLMIDLAAVRGVAQSEAVAFLALRVCHWRLVRQ
jgi:hypothetical protein